ncbi:MAG: 50S ribosomal protein L29 [Tannerellaceae bacterium]|jgi:large subunit ribosomal protein L29|nr:50S ribosomal protein L29 [Tannerellaceae bacterium]
MKIAEIKELSLKELIERIDVDTALLNQKMINHSVTPMDNPAQIKKLRRTIARMKTNLHQRELNK